MNVTLSGSIHKYPRGSDAIETSYTMGIIEIDGVKFYSHFPMTSEQSQTINTALEKLQDSLHRLDSFENIGL